MEVSMSKGRSWSAAAVLVPAVIWSVLAASTKGGRIVEGECREAFGASLCTWAELSGSTVTAYGLDIPVKMVENAPTDGPMVWPPAVAASIPLPAEVRQATGFDHIQVNWEHHGHPPAAYLVPHLDLHLYATSSADVRAVDCVND